jgi:hypothetical protein
LFILKIKISPIQRFGDMSDDIPDFANVAIDNRNQTNHRVVIGLDLLMVKGYGPSKIADIRMQYDLSGFFR